MDILKLDQLEYYVLSLIKRVSELKSENNTLKDSINRLEKEKNVIKLKIEGMLKNLENLE
ncbi:MAG: hypothetical protein A3I04_00750 [Nitrospinae bacterium RIFCSPLOWO2_02_FULL_39_110]|nr:MAG: hypothetical protein A2W53_07870 [Nitrospinae bacterium RIFCSPHIGHO2_02_39_11]OGW00834.1 MAG: hypothetical protein A3D97_01360 [Nitrospinae bacterium RIFCSPHIGHO2_12_FULL_39_42]OGW02417.1 MAG: hypothetical protein A3D20_07660 [Nitrospinae bacterium RIFCSPHIGHO2_02_FULL_39_82]OGW03452.1 MAG: hypothetical protein A3I04_00750 [Nitrospinae bacterium RIFCSPLOWO2_02_FULL_39_110]OGW04963.1 MAG: hypothetical protein A2Z59_06595 [Nitrospinae bacterium RIFCSPLOWO2_02_39_17]OGW08043.1 MAG: hypoth